MLIQTSDLSPSTPLPDSTNLQVYCGLDCCLTHEVRRELEPFRAARPNAQVIYDFERALQAPYLEIMLRGFRVDESARRQAAASLHDRINHLQSVLNEISFAFWGRSTNPRSHQQLKQLFYDTMRLPEVWRSQKGERKLSLNRETLENLYDKYLHARPFINCILSIRDLSKQLEVFESDIDSDKRFRASYNIAGTETGRPSSSTNAFGTGGNAQNIAPGLRYVFVADPGWKLCVIDLEQVEARDVGWFCGCLFNDWSYLDACESGDLHTTNAKRIWRHLKWPNDPAADRRIADQIFYREFTYRDMAKRGSHLCLTDDHEVLTPYGWVPIATKPCTIMQWSEFRSDFQEVSNWIDQEYSGPLVEFEGNSISALMTPEHKVPYKPDQRYGPVKTRAANEGPGTHMPLGNGYAGGSEIVPARLIAAFMSDGYQASTNRMRFHLKKEHKIERLKYLCNIYNFTIEEMTNDMFSVHGNLPKRASFAMFEWTKDCLIDFLDEYKFWDGHIGETYVSLFSIDRNHLEWIQTFGRILGIGGNIRHSVSKTDFSGSSKVYETDYYTLQQNNRKWAAGKSIVVNICNVKGKQIYCPTVKSGFFYIRRNGKISVTGNSNYMGTAWTAARTLKVPQSMMDEFQARYCKGGKLPNGSAIEPAYPCIPRWWQWTAQQIQTTYSLTTPFGRQRHFFGRPDDDTTLREAIAFLPQSTTADRMNLGLWKVWSKMPQVQLLAQTYDSITFQFRETAPEDEIVQQALELIRVEMRHPKGRVYTVPGEAKTGWNWGYYNSDQTKGRINKEGLRKWELGVADDRKRLVGLERMVG